MFFHFSLTVVSPVSPHAEEPRFSFAGFCHFFLLFVWSIELTCSWFLEMGKLTSTIGIPIKLLNEAQVCFSSLSCHVDLIRLFDLFLCLVCNS